MKCTTRTFAPSDDSDHVRYERDGDEPPSVAVATAIATYRDEDVTVGSPLYQFIDPDALDALFAETRSGIERSNGEVRFEVEDVTVLVKSDCVHVYTE